MKKALLIALVLSVPLLGCGEPDKQVDSNKTPPPQYVMVPSQKGGSTGN